MNFINPWTYVFSPSSNIFPHISSEILSFHCGGPYPSWLGLLLDFFLVFLRLLNGNMYMISLCICYWYIKRLLIFMPILCPATVLKCWLFVDVSWRIFISYVYYIRENSDRLSWLLYSINLIPFSYCSSNRFNHFTEEK
jgi:hypothetical protein